ncbi:MAG TPA: CBS domain-containing protein, partial [Exilispira sp.]|nr:CBS domain-containing protein [Exilispira sp.]
VVLSFMELPSQQSGISAVVEKVFEIENPDAIFCFFSFDDSEKAIIIGRSKTEEISINAILSAFGGGGHDLAGSAKVKKSEIFELYNSFVVTLQSVIVRARTVADIMSKEVNTIREKWSIKEASIFLESINQTGAPVVDDNLKITGFISLRDIMKARKSSEMSSPVSAYMRKKVITGTPSMNIKEVEEIFQKYNIGHLPILQDDILVGIVTRKDIIESISGKKIEQQIIIQNNDAVL